MRGVHPLRTAFQIRGCTKDNATNIGESRRRPIRAEKGWLVAAITEPSTIVLEIVRKSGIDPSALYRWRQQSLS